MAYDYQKTKKLYEQLNDQQKAQFANDKSGYTQQFLSDYQKETGNVYTPQTTQTKITSPYQNQGEGNYTYNPTTQMYEKQNTSYQNQGQGNYVYNPVSGYYENQNKVNDSINTPTNSLNQQKQDFTQNMKDFTQNMMDTQNNYANKVNNQYDSMMNQINSLNEQSKKGYSDLMGGGSNYADNFDDAVSNKLKTAFGINSLAEFKSKYPEYYDSLVDGLESIRGVWDNTDPNQRQMLDGQLQGIIGSMVGAGSDTSKIKVLEESVLNKFQNPDQVKSDMQNIVKLQTEGLSTSEIASRMGISEDQVQQAILAYNGLDNKLGEYYKLTDKASKDITEPYDTKLQRLEEEKKIALERANRNVDYLKQDFDTAMDRQKQQNDINLHNADFLAGQYGYGMSRRGIEGLNYVNDQAQQLIDDLTKNYDRNKQEMADGIADIIRNWQYNNEDLTKAMQDALTNAKNNYTSNMLAIQQQYGTVGMQAQQYLAQNIQSFIEQAENIYDNGLARQQENLSNLITNISNLNALAYQDITLRNAKIQQFQSESMNLNRNQLQQLATQLGMDSASYQDLVNYQAQAVANELNGYLPGSGMQFQSQIQSYLDQGYTPTETMNAIMKGQDWQNMVASANAGSNEWIRLNDTTIFNKRDGTTKNISGGNGIQYEDYNYQDMGNYGSTTSYVSSETVNGKNYGVSENTYNGLQNFINEHQVGSTGGQCGKFVNDYLESIGQGRIFTDPITEKKKYINTEEGYKPQVGDVVIMDSPTARKYGHVAIVTAVDGDKITTLESNKKGEGEVFTRTIDTSKQNRLGGQIFGYYHPDGETTNNMTAGGVAGGSNGAEGPLTDYGVPIPYDRSIKALIPTQLMNSELELKKLESNIESLYKAGYSAEDAVLQYMGFNINKEEDKDLAISLVNAVRSLSNEDSVQSAVSYISQKINAGDYNSAIKKVENLVKAEAKKNEPDGYFDESTARGLIKKANELLELANSMPEDIGVFQGTMQKYLKKLKSSDASKLNTAISYLTDEQKLKLVGSNVTDHELEMVKNWIPQIDDRTDTFINKINMLKQNALTNLNNWRESYGLPTLDETALLNNSSRSDLYVNSLNLANNTSNTKSNNTSAIDYLANQLQNRGRISAGGTMVAGNRF